MATYVLVANTTWYLFNYRLSLAREIKRRGHNLILVSPRDRYVEELEGEGFSWRPLTLNRRTLNPLGEFNSFLQLVSLYRSVKPELVHHFTIKPVLYGSLAARMAGRPAVVNSVTGLGYVYGEKGGRGSLMRSAVNGLYRLAFSYKRSRAIFQNSSDMETFRRRGWVSEENAVLIRGSGVDINRFQPQPEPDGRSVVLLAARMLWDKGVQHLVEAGRILRERGIEVEIQLVGEPDPGNPHSISEDQLKAWDSEPGVRWLGHQENMPEHYASAHIVALPTTYFEGVPRSLIEAAACGRALIATDLPGCREIVEHNVTGLLIPPDDPTALADAIETLIKDPSLRASMAQSGRERVVDSLSSEFVDAATLRVYDSLLSTSKQDLRRTDE